MFISLSLIKCRYLKDQNMGAWWVLHKEAYIYLVTL